MSVISRPTAQTPDANKEERLRMTVDFPPATTRRLRMLREKLEAPSRVDVLHEALGVYEHMISSAATTGNDVIVHKRAE